MSIKVLHWTAIPLRIIAASELGRSVSEDDEMKFTKKQGQYLAFIYNYTKIYGRPPAKADMQRYFHTTPPTIHQMILTLEKNGLISRIPGQARSISLLLPKEEIPQLD
jgi:DNA-binding MarR family transcriptional regulator